MTKPEKKRLFEFLIFLALAIPYFIWFAWPSIWTASENLRIVSVFGAGESTHLRLLRDAINRGSFQIHFNYYGHLHFNISLMTLFILNLFAPVTDQQIIIVLRTVPTIFGIATVAVTFLTARRYFGHFAAWGSALLLSIVPLKFLHMAVRSRPDIPQLFFLVLGLYFCLRLSEEKHWKWMIFASLSAGMAFASKYSGIFLLPVIWMIRIIQIGNVSECPIMISPARFARIARFATGGIGIISIVIGIVFKPDFVESYLLLGSFRIDSDWEFHLLKILRIVAILGGVFLIILATLKIVWSGIEKMPKSTAVLNDFIITSLVFVIAFFFTSPFSFSGFGFLKGILAESRHTAFGHGFKANKVGLLWVETLFSPGLLDRLILGLVVASLLLVIHRILKADWRGEIDPEIVLWAWVIFYVTYLVWKINLHFEHYLLPVVPSIIILSMHPVSTSLRYLSGNLTKTHVILISFVIMVIIGVVEIPKSMQHVNDYRTSNMNREETSISVKAGKWLVKRYPESTRIYYDNYSYVPPEFAVSHVSNGGSIKELRDINPDVVIVNRKISGRFHDDRKSSAYYLGEAVFKKKYDYYKALRDGTIGYPLVRDFGDVQIYERN
jgi:hypothetical protein